MTKKNVAVPDVESSIARRSEIKSRIQEITSLLGMGRLVSVGSLGTAAADANSIFKYFINKHCNGSETNIPEEKKSEYRAIKEDAETKSAVYADVKQKVDDLRAELAELKIELESLGRQASVEDVLKYQDEAANIESHIGELNQAIAREEKKVAQVQGNPELLAALQRTREDLMADIALNVPVDQSRLAEIETQIASEEAGIREAKKSGASAAIVISGLQRKVDEAAQSLARVRETLQTVYCDFLISEAEKEGGEFAALSDKLWEKYSRLLALGTMIEMHPTAKGMSIISGVSRNLRVPSFNLKSCQNGCRADGFRYTTNPFDVNAAIDAAKRDIAALGIK